MQPTSRHQAQDLGRIDEQLGRAQQKAATTPSPTSLNLSRFYLPLAGISRTHTKTSDGGSEAGRDKLAPSVRLMPAARKVFIFFRPFQRMGQRFQAQSSAPHPTTRPSTHPLFLPRAGIRGEARHPETRDAGCRVRGKLRLPPPLTQPSASAYIPMGHTHTHTSHIYIHDGSSDHGPWLLPPPPP